MADGAIDESTPLVVAAGGGDVDRAVELLLAGPVDRDEAFTALRVAAANGQLDVVRKFLDNGVPAEGSDASTDSALHAAGATDNAEIVREIVGRGVHVDYPNGKRQTAAHLAAQTGADKSLEALLELGADVNATDVLGFTPLHFSASAGNFEGSELLLRGGADPNVHNEANEEWSPLALAVASGFAGSARLLLENGGNASDTFANGQNLAQVAVDKGHPELVELIVEFGGPSE